jgi:asparagine synthase (glutamine-hydrolysing)
LIEAFARWGLDAVSKFKGMFSFAVWDIQREELTIVRDRLGVKPLYYYIDDRQFIFASEIRSILKTNLVPLQINEAAIHDYLAFQSISSPISIIENIQQLAAGHALVLNKQGTQISCYWDITQPGDHNTYTDKEQIKDRVYALLCNSVKQRLISDVPIGAFLSGGIDSSAVVALMKTVSEERPNTFTIAFDEKEFDESNYASIVANKFNTRHQKILLKPGDMLYDLNEALDAMDSPSADGINSYFVSKAVKQAGLTVALSGIGGDELFAGYDNFKRFTRINRMATAWKYSFPLRNLIARTINSATNVTRSKGKQLLQTHSAEIDELYPVFRRVLTDKQIAAILDKPFHITETIIGRLLAAKRIEIKKLPRLSQMTVAELLGYTQQTLLKDTDQMSMAVSLEVREPFFDHQLIEYVLGIPDNIKVPEYPKQLLVESLRDLLPPEIVHRKKQGFVFPWNTWMKNELKTFCDEHLTAIVKRPFINKQAVLQMWQQFLNGNPAIRWVDVWMFVVLEYWLQKNIDA